MPLRFSSLALWVVFIAGIALSLGGYLLSGSFENHATKQEQQRATDLVANAVSKHIDLNIDALNGIRALFLASQHVDYEDFRIFSQVFLDSNTDIRALEWVPRVPGELRPKFERHAQISGLEGFKIRELDSDGNIVVAGTRQEYFPVFFVHPLTGNEKALGFDLASSKKRLAALEAAKRSGKSTATASINLVRESTKQKGFLILAPVFLPDYSSSASNHDFTLSGFALGVFHLGKFFENALQGLEQETQDLLLSLVDFTDPQNPELIYGSTLTRNSDWQQQRSISVAGRKWKVISKATPKYIDKNQDSIPLWVLLGGFMLSVMLTLYLRTLTQRNEQASALVQQRTRDLDASESRSQLIVTEAADAVILIDSDGFITTFNPAAERIFGYSAEEVMGKNVNILMPDPYHSEHDGYLERFKKTGEKHIIGIGREVTGRRKDGITFPLHLSVGKGTIDSRPVFVGVLSDMTQRKQAQQSLVASKEMAEEANRQKSMFLNMMSHELRTPLTVILGYLPILKDRNKMPAPEIIEQIVTDMDLSGQHLLELINDLLDISKIESGQMDLLKEPVKAEELVHEIVRKFHNQARQSKIDFKIRVDDFTMHADIKRFRQILINLIGNALKFTSAGQIAIEGHEQDGVAVFEVSDTGAGIPAAELPHIFDSFKQADSSSTRSVGGSGLGLAITKRLVELHQGKISVKSEPGKGSVFRFTIKQ